MRLVTDELAGFLPATRGGWEHEREGGLPRRVFLTTSSTILLHLPFSPSLVNHLVVVLGNEPAKQAEEEGRMIQPKVGIASGYCFYQFDSIPPMGRACVG